MLKMPETAGLEAENDNCTHEKTPRRIAYESSALAGSSMMRRLSYKPGYCVIPSSFSWNSMIFLRTS
jgi:hypothetical protein